MRINRPCRSRTDLMLGNASSMRRSSVMAPSSSIGTLKSTRISTRFEATSICSIVFFAMQAVPISNVRNRSLRTTKPPPSRETVPQSRHCPNPPRPKPPVKPAMASPGEPHHTPVLSVDSDCRLILGTAFANRLTNPHDGRTIAG